MAEEQWSTIYKNNTMAKQRGSSRLVKKEEKKVSKQALKLIFFGTVILLLFIFVVMPNLIKLFFSILDKESPLDQSDTVPPQTPILSAVPPEATFSATLNLTGYAEAESKVILVLNNNIDSEVVVDNDGQFNYELALVEGDNELALYGIDGAGNESLKTRSYRIVRDDEAPVLEVTEPTEGQKIELKKNRTLTVKGKTETGIKLTLNGRLLSINDDGDFTGSYYLNEGKNELKFLAVDQAGNQTEQIISVEFKL